MNDSFEEDSENGKGKKKKPKVQRKVGKSVLLKLMFIALVSFIIGGLFTWVIAIAIEEMPIIKGFIGRDNYEDILFLVFLVGFVLSLTTSSYAFLSKAELTGEVYVKQFEEREKAMWKEALAPPKMSAQQEDALKQAAAKRAELEAKFERDDRVDDLDDVLSASNEDGALSFEALTPRRNRSHQPEPSLSRSKQCLRRRRG